jgi:hypothetical protein
MSTRELRIKVRGEFKDLTSEQRADLLAAGAEHDMLGASFTREGHVAYGLAARPFFTLRIADTSETDDDVAAATDRAVASVREWLDACGLSYRLKEPVVEDLSQAAVSKRQRKAQHRG